VNWNEQEMRARFHRLENGADAYSRQNRRLVKSESSKADSARFSADHAAAEGDIYRYLRETDCLRSRESLLAELQRLKSSPMEPGAEVFDDATYLAAFHTTVERLLKEFGAKKP